MLRRECNPGLWVVAVVCAFGFGCGSTAAPAPIPDPGGPFQTSVPASTKIDALTAAQLEELCNEAAAATYLAPGLGRELTCRELASEAIPLTTDGGMRDAGVDGGLPALSACQASYDSCHQDGSQNLIEVACGIPSYTCTATVELLSACFNEIANSSPATCVTFPTCAMIAAAGTTRFDAGFTTIGECPGAPSLPACDRLAQQCPDVLLDYDPY